MTQCAKIIVGFMANVGNVFYPTFSNVFFYFLHFIRFLTFLRATACNDKRVFPTAEASVLRPSVRPSYCAVQEH